jgi:uncharacterized protein YrrD
MMQFREGAKVLNARGEPVGEVSRVVLNPHTKEVSEVVVHKGVLFTTEKVVPLSLIGSATRDRVVLRKDVDRLEQLLDFEERYYIRVDEAEARAEYRQGAVRPLYWYPPAGVPETTGPGVIGGPVTMTQPPYIVRRQQHIPEGAVALKEGAKVITSDDEHVGNVKSVLTGAEADRASHLVIERGILLKEEKLVPIDWVSWIGEDEAHLSVGSQLLEALPPYEDPRKDT